MAYQHFYSRVPARISLYKKTDGFDTFAHSAALDDEFILKELSPIYLDKLGNNDINKIRRGEVAPIYTQTATPSGYTVQSALSYVPRDYTGERSAYLVHSLVLDPEERNRIFTDKRAFDFNPDMFITDISLFNVTSEKAAPNRNYPTVDYVPKRLEYVSRPLSQYSREMERDFIYAVIQCVCEKGKNIFFRLPVDDSRLSREALDFINSIMAVLPYSFREKLSFVTYVNDSSHYENFNLKCISSVCRNVPLSRGVTFDFAASTVNGVPVEKTRANTFLTDFFYTLLEKADIRDKFHEYMMRINATYGLDAPDIRTLSDLVFLFLQCSGSYEERTVLQNDAMVDSFFTVFEKYKDALVEEYRARAYKCLERYPTSHTPIPKSIFGKLCAIYPTERTGARRVALNAILNLIHTDTMRAELFAFLRANYQSETPETKRAINEDLSRVFYGGFLQNEILDFFDTNFRGEPAETQALIVGKMLLAIRTASIQNRVVSILDRHYDALSPALRVKIYNTFFEMLPECDGLSSLLVGLVNSKIDKENGEFRNAVAAKIAEYTVAAYSRRDRRLLTILATPSGFCEDVVTRVIFVRPDSSEIYGDYIRLLASDAKHDKLTKLIHIHKIVPEMQETVYVKLLEDCKAAFGDVKWATLYEIIEADRIGAATLPQGPLSALRSILIYPAAVNSIYDVFKVKQGKDGINVIKRFAENNAAISESTGYKEIEEYVEMVDAVCAEDAERAFSHLKRLPDDPAVRYDISEHIRMCSLNRNTQSEKTALIFELCINALKDAGLRFDAVFTQYKNVVIKRNKSNFGRTAKPERVMRESVAEATDLVVRLASDICYAHPSFIDLVCADNSGIARVISNFYLSCGYAALSVLNSCLADAPDELRQLAKYAVKKCRTEKWGSFFGRN